MGGRTTTAGRVGAAVVTLVCVAVVMASMVLATEGVAPAVVMRQSGHWIYNSAMRTVTHVDGGTGRADARVEIPDPPAEPLFTVQGRTQGFLVAMDRIVVFGKSTLTVESTLPISFSEVPVAIEVAGGPYLVYREAGTIVRLGDVPAFIQAAGRLGRPVWTESGVVWVQRTDSGALCVLRPDAQALDCTLQAPDSPGALTVTTGQPAYVATVPDAAQLVGDTQLGAAVGLGTDVATDGLVADRDTHGRLAVVDPTANRLQIVDTAGVPSGVAGGPGTATDLGPGRFTAPFAADGMIVVLDELTNRVLTFDTAGVLQRTSDLPDGTGQAALSRGEDGRIYVDDRDGAATHIVGSDGSVTSVPAGGDAESTRPQGVSVVPLAAPPARRALVAVPLVGRNPFPPGSRPDRALSWPGAGRPALSGSPVPGPRPPDRQPPIAQPPIAQPPIAQPPVIDRPDVDDGPPVSPPPVDPEPKPPPVTPPLAPRAPTDVRATADPTGDVKLTWSVDSAETQPVRYEVFTDEVLVATSTVGRGRVGRLEVGRPYTFTVRAVTSAGAGPLSAPSAAVTPYRLAGEPGALTATRDNKGGNREIRVSWTAADPRGGTIEAYEVQATGADEDVTETVSGRGWVDRVNSCAPQVTYEVRALTRPPEGGELIRGEPARFTLGSRAFCTPIPDIVSINFPTADTLEVVVRCSAYGTVTKGTLSLRIDGEERWTGDCSTTSGGGDGYAVANAGRVLSGPHTAHAAVTGRSATFTATADFVMP